MGDAGRTTKPPERVVIITGGGGGLGWRRRPPAGPGRDVSPGPRRQPRRRPRRRDGGRRGDGRPRQSHSSSTSPWPRRSRPSCPGRSARSGASTPSSTRPPSSIGATFDAVTPQDFDEVFHINALAPLLLARAAMPDMASRGWGRIVNVTSTGVYEGGFTMTSAIYEASKGAVAVFTKMLSRHGAPHGVLVNSVCPGGMRTRMLTRRDVARAGGQGRARDDPAAPHRRAGGDRPDRRLARQRPEHAMPPAPSSTSPAGLALH